MGAGRHLFKMAMSGIEPDKDDCMASYTAVKSKKIRCAVYGFNDKKTKIITKHTIEKTADYQADWDNFVGLLPEKEGCYACYDFEYKSTDGYNDGDKESAGTKSKIIMIMWAPDNAKPQVKMLVPSSFAGIKALCDGSQANYEIHDADEKLLATATAKLKF